MTQDEIIEMAKQAGITACRDFKLESFARRIHHIATVKEREACAKVCINRGLNYKNGAREFFCADAIRARGES